MNSLDAQYNEMLGGMQQSSATEKEALRIQSELPDACLAAQWTVHKTQYDGRPYVRAACGKCRTTYTTEGLEFVFNHCGMAEPMPKEISKRLEALQIKLKIRVQTFVDKILGESRPAPAPAPNLSNF